MEMEIQLNLVIITDYGTSNLRERQHRGKSNCKSTKSCTSSNARNSALVHEDGNNAKYDKTC